MQAAVIVWWLCLWCVCLVFCEAINWSKLKEELNASDNRLAAITIAANWSNRPLDFFQGLEEGPWRKIAQRLSVAQIDEINPKEFDSMNPKLLRNILYFEKVCPTTDITFWTEERMQYISTKCLHRILAGTEAPVQLGQLWRKINWLVVHYFTNEMKPSIQNIDLGDFYFMEPDVLKEVLQSVPELCSSLGVAFWTEKTIKGISGECLHELLTKYEMPVKLESMWKDISVSTLQNLLKKTEFSLDFVHPDDRISAEDWIERHIKVAPIICQALNISFWNSETIKYMTEDCLYQVIGEAIKPIVLGELWEHICPTVVKKFTQSMLYKLRNVAGSDFQYMTSSLLQSVFSWEALNHLLWPPTNIVLSARASKVSINSLQFAEIVRSGPSVAGQLLWYSKELPGNVLAHCDGIDIHGLELALLGEEKLDWKGLFAKLESEYFLDGRAELFDQMIQLISNNQNAHFCATLFDLDEYLSLTWIHRNLSAKCRSRLRFNPDHVSRLFFSTLDLFKENYSWENMLGEYSNNDWALLSRSKRVATLLGSDCDFWGTIETGSWLEAFRALDSLVLKSILPECTLKISKILANSPDKIPLLADDAFSRHAVNQLPCRLSILSPAQIAYLSKKTFKNIDEPTSKEISQHFLSGITLDELKTLNLQQFKSLYESQWVFIPKSLKNEAFYWRLEEAQSQLLKILDKIKGHGRFISRYLAGDRIYDFNTADDTLTLLMEMYKDEYQKIPECYMQSFILSIRNSYLKEIFIKTFQGSPLLRVTSISLICNAEELWNYNRKEFDGVSCGLCNSLYLSHNLQSGFDRDSLVNILKWSPLLFATPNVRVGGQGIRDTGGIIRVLANQLLIDIQRDLVVGHSQGFSVKKSFSSKVKMDFPTDSIEAADTQVSLGISADLDRIRINSGKSSDSKFVWGVSKESGVIVGLAFGKALQLGMRLPFALDLDFYELLIDTRDKTIEGYYRVTYDQEVYDFEQSIRNFLKIGNLKALLDIIPRPDRLCFTNLSTKANTEEAKGDRTTKANLWGCSDEDCYASIKELEGKEFIEKYVETILEKTRNEFKEFVRELVRGLGMALQPVPGPMAPQQNGTPMGSACKMAPSLADGRRIGLNMPG